MSKAKYNLSELVRFQDGDCVVIDIKNHRNGSIQYQLWNIDSGDTFHALENEVCSSPLESINFDDIVEENPSVQKDIGNQDREVAQDFGNFNLGLDITPSKSMSTTKNPVRHSHLSVEDLNKIAEANTEKSTKKTTKWAVKVFKDWLVEREYNPNFEELPSDNLAKILRQFYGEANTKSSQTYSRSSLVGIRAGLNRHLQAPPFNKIMNIVTDMEFMQANKILTGRVKLNRENGLDVTKHKKSVGAGDIERMYTSGVLSNENPEALQNKVFFELCLHFGRRGREGLHSLKRDSFVFVPDDLNPNIEYVTLGFNEKSKKNQGTDPKRRENDNRMYSCTDDSRCPVYSLKKYLSLLNPTCESFFQKPKSCSNVLNEKIWYTSRPIGINTLANMMKKISFRANLSSVYTNHCIRATTSTVLAHANLNANDIISVTGHKDPKSLLPYVASTSNEQRKNMSSILHQFGKSTPVKDKENEPKSGTSCSPTPLKGNNVPFTLAKSPEESTDLDIQMQPTVSVTNRTEKIVMAQDMAMKVFEGNMISGGNFTINFNFQN